MLSKAYHDPNGSIARSDPGLLGLEHEIAATPTDQLIDHATLLIELPQPHFDAGMPRLRLTLWELQRRIDELGEAA